MTESKVVITDLAERAIRRGQIGLAVGVIAGGEHVFAGFGRARDDSSEPPNGQTIFELGSITKVFTGVLLAEMAEEGLVRLDDPLDVHLPSGVSPPIHDGAITLADLASHGAGLPRDPKGTIANILRHPLHPYRALLDAYAALAVQDLYTSLSRTKARAAGRRPRYSNVGAGVLGNVLASRAGLSYQEVVRARVCVPLGLRDTFVEVPEDARARLAQGHSRRGRPRPPFDAPALIGAGSLRASVDDMLRFLGANLDAPAGRLGAALELAQRPRTRMNKRIETGLGWVIAPVRRRPLRMHWHNGGTGGFRGFVAFVRETKTAVVVLGNTNRSVDLLGLRLLEALQPDER